MSGSVIGINSRADARRIRSSLLQAEAPITASFGACECMSCEVVEVASSDGNGPGSQIDGGSVEYLDREGVRKVMEQYNKMAERAYQGSLPICPNFQQVRVWLRRSQHGHTRKHAKMHTSSPPRHAFPQVKLQVVDGPRVDELARALGEDALNHFPDVLKALGTFSCFV